MCRKNEQTHYSRLSQNTLQYSVITWPVAVSTLLSEPVGFPSYSKRWDWIQRVFTPEAWGFPYRKFLRSSYPPGHTSAPISHLGMAKLPIFLCYPRIKKMDPIKQNKANPSSSSSNKSFRMASLTCLRNRVGSWNTKHQQTLFAPMLCSRWSSHFGLGAGWEWQACLRCKTPCPNARSTIVIDIYNHRYFRTFTCYILSVSKCLICQTHVVPSYTIHLAIKQSHGRRLTLGNGYLRSRNQSHSTIRLI